MDALYGSLDSRLILVVAGAGYGKTGLLAQFAKTEGFTFSWLTLDDREQDLRVFGEAIVSSLARSFPGFGHQTMQLLTSASAIEQNVGLLVRTLTREISAHLTQPLCMVIDDFHLVESSTPVIQFIDRLVTELPDDAHLIIASRSLPPLQLGVLIAQQQVAALGQSALRLDQTETRQLIAALNNVDEKEIEEASAAKAFSETEGWLVGLVMTTHISRLRDAQVGLSMPRAVDLLSDYLLVRVLQSLPLELQEFLYRTSILDNISLPFCKQVGWDDVEVRIAEVERRNLFLQPQSSAGGEEVTYRYHPLFREFLVQRLREDDPLRYAQLQHDVGAGYEQAGNVELAMRHFLSGGWSTNVMQLIEAHSMSFFQLGRFRTVLDWLARLDVIAPGIREDNHVLWQYEVLAHMNLGHDAEAMEAVNRLDGLYLRTGDLARRDTLNMRRGLLLYRSSEYEKALACANTVIQSIYPQPPWAVVESRRIAALCLLELGRLSDALETITQAEPLAQSLGQAGYDFLTRVKLARSLVMDELGNTTASLRAVSDALSIAERTQDGNLIAESLAVMAEGLLYNGEHDHINSTIKRSLELAETNGNQGVRIYGLRILAFSLMFEGRCEEAIQTGIAGLTLARQSTRLADRGWTLILCLLDQCCLLCYCAHQQTSQSERNRLLAQALSLAREAVAIAESSHSVRYKLWSYARLGAVQLAQGDGDLAVTAFNRAEALRDQFQDNGAGLLSLWQLLATWNAPMPDMSRVERQLKVVNALVETRNQTYFIRAEGEHAWQTYLTLKEAPDLRNLVALRRTDESETSADSVSKDAIGTHIVLVEHDVRASGFGLGRVWRGDELVSIAQWGWSIPRELFFYILTLQRATRAQMGLAFWPDANASTMQSSFHNAKFAIRTAIGKPAMIYANGVYSINPELDYIYDVNEFEHLLGLKDQLQPSDQLVHLLQAGNLYQDNFLIDFQSEWITPYRSALQEKFYDCCLRASAIAIDLNQPDSVIGLLQRAYQTDSINEDVARALMKLHWQCGQRRAALDTYQALKTALAREVGIKPDAETEKLVSKIKTG